MTIAEHRKAIDPDAKPAGGRKTKLQNTNVIVIGLAGFLITFLAHLGLILEELVLQERIIQLAEGIGNLTPKNVALKTLGKTRIIATRFR